MCSLILVCLLFLQTFSQEISIPPNDCSIIAINNAIGQSFTVSSPTGLYNTLISVYITPELYYITSYILEVYEGAGFSGNKIATSVNTVVVNSQSSEIAKFHDFRLGNVNLKSGSTYSWKMIRQTSASGGFARCGNVYTGGNGYWLGSSSEVSYDYAFNLYLTAPYYPSGNTPVSFGVSCSNPTSGVAINDAIAQSFTFLAGSGHFSLDLSILIGPESYYTTSYRVELYAGDGGGDTIAVSNIISINSKTSGTPTTYYNFVLIPTVTLQKNAQYTWKLIRKSDYSGSFSYCPNVDAFGTGYWLGYSREAGRDYVYQITATPLFLCVPGIDTPVRYVNGDIQCMAINGRDCLWEGCATQLANTPLSSVNPLVCGSMHESIYGGTGYNSPDHWCTKALKFFSQPAWQCLPNIDTPIRLNSGNIECMALDGKNCLWGGCTSQLSTPITSIKPLSCGPVHQQVYGGNGYQTPGHWCHTAFVLIKKPSWNCVAGVDTPVRSINGYIECMSADSTNCFWGGCQTSVDNKPLESSLKPLQCPNTDYSNPIHWCYKTKAVLG